jgi:DHA1 family tetracycline resistance protein-like MFS transporter
MVLYAAYRYGWDARDVGFLMAVVGLSSALVQGLAVGPVIRRYGERRALLGGLACGALGFAGYGLAPTGLLFLAAVPVVALWGLASPAAQGIMTRYVDGTRYGELQGANGAVMGVATMIGPTLFALTFARFIGEGARLHLPGAAFLLAALMLVAGLALARRVTAEAAA